MSTSHAEEPTTLPPEEAAVRDAAAEGPVCSQCDQPVPNAEASVCPHCGWYASAGVYVDIAPEWEAARTVGAAGQQQPSHLDVWLNLIPAWLWVAIASAVAALAASGAARLLLEDTASLTNWSVTQLFVGALVAMGCHVIAYILMSVDDPNMGVGDLVVSPTTAWRKLIAQMPRHQWVLDGAAFSAGAVLGSVLIVGHIPYDRVWDWGITPPAKKDLIKAIASSAPGAPEMTMEDAMAKFADDAAVQGAGGGKPKPTPAGPKVIARKKTDALILGYELDRNGMIDTFLVASEFNGHLFYAGRVSPRFSPDENLQTLARLRAAKAGSPVVSAPDGAQWVKPRFPCRVSYSRRVESGRMQGLVWEELLGEVKLPW
ncbi:MAG: hypothetical protein AAGB00_02805 [Planctomycetota bacterium]